ncbi:MAG: hypothetical protein QJR07_16195 [Acetobacteraceae bacterium]|nr:hypothetical protein [Acetobacteraceae bacterium]
MGCRSLIGSAIAPALQVPDTVQAGTVECGHMALYDLPGADEWPAMRRLIAAGAQLRTWRRDVMQAAWRSAHELYEETGARNPHVKWIWKSYRAWRDDQYQWFRVAKNSFENFAYAATAACQRGLAPSARPPRAAEGARQGAGPDLRPTAGRAASGGLRQDRGSRCLAAQRGPIAVATPAQQTPGRPRR